MTADAVASARRAVDKLRASGDADLKRLADGLATYLASAPTVRLDEALGLHPRWGEKGWWTAEPKAARDTIIEKLDAQCFGQLSVQAAARGMLELVRRHRERSPDLALNEVELLAQLHRPGAGLPGVKQLTNIIAARREAAGREIRPLLKFPATNFPMGSAIHAGDNGNARDDRSGTSGN